MKINSGYKCKVILKIFEFLFSSCRTCLDQKKKLPMFLSRLNEISGRCEKIVKVANTFLRAKLEEKCEIFYEQIMAID